jgi:hypothetical protein
MLYLGNYYVKKSLIGRFLLIGILAYGCAFGFGQQIGHESFLINPLSSVDRIVPNSTEAELIRIYGAKNVKHVTIDAPSGLFFLLFHFRLHPEPRVDKSGLRFPENSECR